MESCGAAPEADADVEVEGGNVNPLKDFGVRGDPRSILFDDEEPMDAWRADAGTKLGKRLLRAFHGAWAESVEEDEEAVVRGEIGEEARVLLLAALLGTRSSFQ